MSGGDGVPPRRRPIARSALSRRASKPDKRQPTARYAASQRAFADAKVLVWERDQGRCVAQLAGCEGRGWDFHHRLPRGMGGASRDEEAHSASRLIVVCRNCHRIAESDRAAAEESGLLVRHGVLGCKDVPLRYRGRWTLLGDHGSVVVLCWSEMTLDASPHRCLREAGHPGNEHRDGDLRWTVVA